MISARCVAHDCTRLYPGHLSVRVGDGSRPSEETLPKNLKLRLSMRLSLSSSLIFHYMAICLLCKIDPFYHMVIYLPGMALRTLWFSLKDADHFANPHPIPSPYPLLGRANILGLLLLLLSCLFEFALFWFVFSFILNDHLSII